MVVLRSAQGPSTEPEAPYGGRDGQDDVIYKGLELLLASLRKRKGLRGRMVSKALQTRKGRGADSIRNLQTDSGTLILAKESYFTSNRCACVCVCVSLCVVVRQAANNPGLEWWF